MELSQDVLDGLSLAGDDAHIPDRFFNILSRRVCENDPNLKSVDRGVLKQVSAALVTLIVEAAKHNADGANLSTILEDCKFSQDRISTLNNVYLERKSFIQILLGGMASSPPHIVDVDWRLDYYIKNNQLEKVNQAVYMVTFKTEVAGQPGTKDVQFSCTMEQLQDLVSKLKDACKSLERVGQF